MPNFLDNVRYASAGIRSFFTTEKNGRIQGLVAIITITSGFAFGITTLEWMLVLGCIVLVISAGNGELSHRKSLQPHHH